MASYYAIAAMSQAILSVLANSRPRPEFSSCRFELYQAKDFQNPMDDGISLHLFRVATNASRRTMTPYTAPDGRRYRPPLPLDLQYMLTAWARDAVRQQRLLGWAMRTLEDNPIFPSGLLNESSPEPDTFHASETVELVRDTLSIGDMYNLWEIAKHQQQPSATYTARLISVESKLEMIEPGLVQTRVLRAGSADL